MDAPASSLREALERIALAGLGAASITVDRAEGFAEALIDRVGHTVLGVSGAGGAGPAASELRIAELELRVAQLEHRLRLVEGGGATGA